MEQVRGGSTSGQYWDEVLHKNDQSLQSLVQTRPSTGP